jgi:hypothetical protein
MLDPNSEAANFLDLIAHGSGRSVRSAVEGSDALQKQWCGGAPRMAHGPHQPTEAGTSSPKHAW